MLVFASRKVCVVLGVTLGYEGGFHGSHHLCGLTLFLSCLFKLFVIGNIEKKTL